MTHSPGASEIKPLLERVAQYLGYPVELVDTLERNGRLESLTIRLSPPDRACLEMDIAHVETFESSTWEVPPPDLRSLVGARGHTLHARKDSVEFRLATWVDSFDAATISIAVGRRLLKLAGEHAPPDARTS